MRKLLLSTTALIAAGTISSAAIAESSVSGNYTFSYQDYDSGITNSGASGDHFYSIGNINFNFTNKTDSGLEVGMLAVMNFKGTEGASDSFSIDDHRMTIKGGFGTLQLGSDDGIGDMMTRSASDLIGKDALNSGETTSFHPNDTAANSYSGNTTTSTSHLIDDNADLPGQDIDDVANITYILPTMGGLTAGVSFRDGGDGTTENDDVTEFAGKYTFTSGDVTGTLHYGQNSKDSTAVGGTDTDASSAAIDVTMGPLRAVYATAEVDFDATVKTEIQDFGISYNLGNGLTLAAVNTEVDESGTAANGETLDITSVSATYAITNGLTAYLTYHDYDYENGTSDGTDDDGSATMISIKATF